MKVILEEILSDFIESKLTSAYNRGGRLFSPNKGFKFQFDYPIFCTIIGIYCRTNDNITMKKNAKKTLQEQINEKEWLTVEEAIETINEAFRNLEEVQL